MDETGVGCGCAMLLQFQLILLVVDDGGLLSYVGDSNCTDSLLTLPPWWLFVMIALAAWEGCPVVLCIGMGGGILGFTPDDDETPPPLA